MVVVSPALWDTRSVRSTALLPLSALYACGIRIAETLAGPPRRAPVPVVCAGGALVGGSGKTPVALALARRLRLTQPALDVHFLSRGYPGSSRGPLRVELARHDAQRVGDEALLLARGGPTWVARRRIEGAVAASDAGAQLLVMDDGLQHHGIHRDLSFLCVDARYKTGNGRLLPAGPLREPFHKALARCEAVVAVMPSCSASPTQSGALDEERLRDELVAQPARSASSPRFDHSDAKSLTNALFLITTR
ncbi:hypothetical protein AB1Y20_001370 [Prymnesium parvum]|uniref:tetraacyldisaccharide 4'-kinase n=1 Tax=Prymnesium parvum TaxID=97485 RepID=A0AB34KB42_PRYPA